MHLVPQFFRHLVTHVRAKGMYEKMYHISAKNWDATATTITSGPHAAFLTSLSRQANSCAHEPSLQAELEKMQEKKAFVPLTVTPIAAM